MSGSENTKENEAGSQRVWTSGGNLGDAFMEAPQVSRYRETARRRERTEERKGVQGRARVRK